MAGNRNFCFNYQEKMDLTKARVSKASKIIVKPPKLEDYDTTQKRKRQQIIDTSGTAEATCRYDDFGNTTVTKGEPFDNEICCTDQIYCKSTGLYYCNARYYISLSSELVSC